ncbi:MAG: hypothetical protein FWH06_02560, partial [Oscillospiraceae bacterium]|nr:hypothetical protein [Oscillospiraceae bacterium]
GSWGGGQGHGGAGGFQEYTPLPPPPPPEDHHGLPRLPNFNPHMTLENIAVWWGDDVGGGKKSADTFLRAAALPLCRLLEEADFTPPRDETPMRFTLDCNGGETQELTVYAGDIASFPELPGQYFRIPHISAIGRGLLEPAAGEPPAPETTRGRVEASAILAYFSAGGSYVELERHKIGAVASAFFDMEKTEAPKPDELSAQREALVFFSQGNKYYVTRYDGCIEFYGDGAPRVWYEVNDAEAEHMAQALR